MTIVAIEHKENSNLAKQLEFQELKHSNEMLQMKLKEAESSLNSIQKELLRHQQAKQFALDEVASLRFQFGVLKQKILDSKTVSAEFEATKVAYESSLRDYETRIENLLLEKDLALKSLKTEQEARNSEEERLQIAHHHLAKKVREVAELTDRIEAQGARLTELYEDLEYSRTVVNGLKEELAEQAEQEKQQQLRLREAQLASESLAATWEDKYYRLYEKLQEDQARIKELSVFEEKYRQMQVLWSSFGKILEKSTNQECSHKETCSSGDSVTNPRGQMGKKHYQNLYDFSQSLKSQEPPVDLLDSVCPVQEG